MEEDTKQKTEDGGQKTEEQQQPASAAVPQTFDDTQVASVEEKAEAAEQKPEEEAVPPVKEKVAEEVKPEIEEFPSEEKEEKMIEEGKQPVFTEEPSYAKATEGRPAAPAKTVEEEDEGKLRASIKGARNWYAVHTYSGYEDRVAENLKQRIESLDMSEKIFDVMVPKEVAYEIKNGKKRKVEKKIFPGYVLVDMIVTEDSWYVVRNTPNVTGFVGFGTTPTPISDEEVKQIRKRMGVEEPKYKIDLVPGDLVKITDGPFKDFDGTIQEIDEEKGKIKVLVSMFGRETPVELDFLQIKKV